MEIIYRAFDGTEFDDEWKCQQYEDEKNFDFSLLPLCIFADESGNKLRTPTTLQELYDTFECCEFWFIPSAAEDAAVQLSKAGFYVGNFDEVHCTNDICFDDDNIGDIFELARNLEQTFPMLNQKEKKKEG